MNKRLVLINGTMGVGKTAVSMELLKLLPPCAFLDGDWCWNMNPFVVTEETKRMVMGNIVHLLKSFLACSETETVIFCWVMHEKSILDELLSRLHLNGVDVYIFTLMASERALTERIKKDVDRSVRSMDVLERSLQRLPLYEAMDFIKIDVSDITPRHAAERIASELYVCCPK